VRMRDVSMESGSLAARYAPPRTLSIPGRVGRSPHSGLGACVRTALHPDPPDARLHALRGQRPATHRGGPASLPGRPGGFVRGREARSPRHVPLPGMPGRRML
jgi:hypothetical protein